LSDGQITINIDASNEEKQENSSSTFLSNDKDRLQEIGNFSTSPFQNSRKSLLQPEENDTGSKEIVII
jgi:hypothetical protein